MLTSGDNVKLLLAGEVDELHSVARHTDREVCIFGLFGMLHAVLQLVHAEDVDIQVVRTLIKVAVEDMAEVVDALVVVVTESVGADGLGVGDAVER